jgi:hypothetical protein
VYGSDADHACDLSSSVFNGEVTTTNVSIHDPAAGYAIVGDVEFTLSSANSSNFSVTSTGTFDYVGEEDYSLNGSLSGGSSGGAVVDECGVCDGDGSDDLGCGCFEDAALSYWNDADGDGLGNGIGEDYCEADLPSGWVCSVKVYTTPITIEAHIITLCLSRLIIIVHLLLKTMVVYILAVWMKTTIVFSSKWTIIISRLKHKVIIWASMVIGVVYTLTEQTQPEGRSASQ